MVRVRASQWCVHILVCTGMNVCGCVREMQQDATSPREQEAPQTRAVYSNSAASCAEGVAGLAEANHQAAQKALHSPALFDQAPGRLRCQQAEGAAEQALLEDGRGAILPGARVALGELTFLSKFNCAVSHVVAPGSTRLCTTSVSEAEAKGICAAPSLASARLPAPASAADSEQRDKNNMLARLQKLELELERCQQGGNASYVTNLLGELAALSDLQLDYLKSVIEEEKKERERTRANSALEEAMLCPISLMPMQDPVVAADGWVK
jgi:hypothetical protein